MTSAVVTGAASGIGRALAVELGSRGHDVHAVDLVDGAPSDLPARQASWHHHQVDVADLPAMEALAGAVEDVEIVCLNAGVVGTAMGPPWEASAEEWHRLLGVNLLGVVNGLRVFVPLLSGRGGGRVVITASLAGLVTFPGGGAYAATKHAVVAVAEQASLALREDGIRVTVACPALVRSGMSETGEDPVVVAREMLAASERGQFLVAPAEWRAAVLERARTLVAGTPPMMPAPDAVPGAGPTSLTGDPDDA